MKKAIALSGLSVLAAVSVSLAAAPKAMDCDSWECNGSRCAPAKYVAVRNSPILPGLGASPIYGAALMEGGFAAAGLLVVVARSWKRRRAAPAKELALETP